jgi:hypothetical protein
VSGLRTGKSIPLAAFDDRPPAEVVNPIVKETR